MNILGISAFYHDSAASIIQDGVIIAAAQEERFTRKKHDEGFPVKAIQYCLKESGLTLNQLDAIVFYDKPLLKFERLLETYYAFSPKGFRSFLMSIPVWLKDKMFLKNTISGNASFTNRLFNITFILSFIFRFKRFYSYLSRQSILIVLLLN